MNGKNMTIVKMPDLSNPSLDDVMYKWVTGEYPKGTVDEFEGDARVALLRVLLHRSNLSVNEVKDIFFAVFPFESDRFFNNIIEYELG